MDDLRVQDLAVSYSRVAAWSQKNATVIVVPEAEHDLTLPDGTLAPLYEQRLVEWLGALS